jgi:hypothetical protein
VPVTAKLSRKFYERFGDDIAGEFVDWFNAVDSTYQQQLRELNDLNWERFKAEMDARFAQFRAEMDVRFAQCEARLTEKFSDKLADTKADIMKWMFIYWSGTVLSLGGLMVAVLAIVLRR